MEIKVAKDVNIRTLSWAIRKQVGLYLGGFNETHGVVQTGGIGCNALDGVTVSVPDGTPIEAIAAIQNLIAQHDLDAPLPTDFPADAPAPEPPPDPAIAQAAAVNAAAAAVVAEIDQAFTARTTKLTDAEKGAMRDKVVALIAKAQGR